MKPYKLIKGNDDNIAAFEDEVSAALAEGYEFVNRLVTKVVASNGINKVLFFQPMVFEEAIDDVYEDDDDEDELI